MIRHAIVCASYILLLRQPPTPRFQRSGGSGGQVLRRENEVLLSLRQGTGWMDGYYSLPSGHIEAHESPKQALIRETKEEIGVTLHADDLQLVLS